MSDVDDLDPPFLTTREVAQLLRVKERKVYELAAAGEIPHKRLTGKLLFPREAIAFWLGGDTPAVRAAPRPLVVAGSHDPLLEWAMAQSGCGLASIFSGSGDGLARFCRGEASLAAMHLPEDGDWNIATVAEAAPHDAVLVALATRTQGLMSSPAGGAAPTSFSELEGRRIAMRQDGSGSRALFDKIANEAGFGGAGSGAPVARSEMEAAAAVSSGEADAALGLEAVARQFRLAFVPMVEERFDLLVDRRAFFSAPVQMLFEFFRTEIFRDKAASLSGYDIRSLGTVRWLGD